MIAVYGPKIYALSQRKTFIANVGFAYGATSVNRDFLVGSLSCNLVRAPLSTFALGVCIFGPVVSFMSVAVARRLPRKIRPVLPLVMVSSFLVKMYKGRF